jgi:hypothetical protein
MVEGREKIDVTVKKGMAKNNERVLNLNLIRELRVRQLPTTPNPVLVLLFKHSAPASIPDKPA